MKSNWKKIILVPKVTTPLFEGINIVKRNDGFLEIPT
jgi:hypothetical protein